MRRIRLAGLLSLDVLTLAGALIVALWIRFDGDVPTQYYNRALDVLPLFVAGDLLSLPSLAFTADSGGMPVCMRRSGSSHLR